MKVTNDGSLSVPPGVQGNSAGREIARVWVVNNRVKTTIRTGIWDDPASWGVFLVDLAKQVADAYKQTEGSNEEEVLRRIRQAFDAEWEAPTDKRN
jgi:hypothetical protein